jgi:hypothetical protein
VSEEYLDIQFFNEKRELSAGRIFMSYGLLSTLSRIVGDVNRIGVIDIDPDMAAEVLDECLVPRTSTGKPNRPASYEMPDLPIEEAGKIFTWVKEHLLNFFIRRLQSTADLMTQNKERLQSLGSFLGGSNPSPSSEPSSGV